MFNLGLCIIIGDGEGVCLIPMAPSRISLSFTGGREEKASTEVS